MSKLRHKSPKQQIRCTGKKPHVNPQQIIGPPRLRTSHGTFASLELFAKDVKPKSEKRAMEAKIHDLFLRAQRKKKR